MGDDPIEGATSSTLSLTAPFEGVRVRVEATPVRAGYDGAAAVASATSEIIAKGLFRAVPEVIVGGEPSVGATLTAAISGHADPVADSYSYQWLADGEEIPGQTGSAFDVPSDLVGSDVTVRVTAVRAGYDSASGVGTASAASQIAPGQYRTLPVVRITGEAAVGERLSAEVTQEATPLPASYAYQWYADGAPIDGAVSDSYRPVSSQLGAVMTVSVRAQLEGWDAASGEAVSDPTAEVVLGTFATTVQVSVTGQPLVGETLSATILLGPAPGPDSYEYQWLADGENLAGATGASLTLTDQLLGKRLSVLVTPVLAGYDPLSGRGEGAASDAVATVSLTLQSVTAGERVVVTGGGHVPGTVYTVELHSTPVPLGSVTADAAGRISQSFAIPADTAPGPHQVKLFDINGVERASVSLTVRAAPAAAIGDGGNGSAEALSVTGSELDAGWAFLGLALLVSGAGLILVRQRRAQQESAAK